MPRKRGRDEMEASEPPKEDSTLDRLRSMWEFASLAQYIYTFGEAVKIDKDFDIEDLETECLKPGVSDKLEDIGLNLLRWISSHRGLSLEIWDEYTRRQYLSKAPTQNPYGDEEEPKKFREFDIFQKIRVLHQLSVWTFWNPDRMREKMPVGDTDQTEWRVEELGYDRDERLYYLLDDNRLYRRTDPPIPAAPRAKPKANSLKAQAARRRASKRRRIEDSETPEVKDEDESIITDGIDDKPSGEGSADVDTNAGFKWECIAINLTQYRELIESLKKTKDPNEKVLRDRLQDQVVPIIEKGEESQRRKIERKERELLNLQKLAGAKRSSRLADRHDRERQEREAADAERQRAADLAAAHKQQEQQEKMEQDRQSRMMTREQRIKDREFKRILHEEELARIEEEAKKVEAGEARGSERHLKAQMEKRKKDLEELSAEEDWVFDCAGCGTYGKNVDDGSHSVACEQCSVWQHSKCLGITKAEAEKDNFHFVCKDCKQRIEDAKKPKISLKFRTGLSSSPTQPRSEDRTDRLPGQQLFTGIEVPKKRGPGRPPGTSRPTSQGSMSNGHAEPHTTNQLPGLNGSPYFQQPVANGYTTYGSSNRSMNAPPHFAPYVNGYPSNGLASSPSAMVVPRQPFSPPQNLPNRNVSRPGSSYTQSMSQSIHQFPASPNASANVRPTSSHSQHLPYYNGSTSNHNQGSPQPKPSPSPTHDTYLANSTTSQNTSNAITVGSGSGTRFPSPVQNRPSMSPTQGNYGPNTLIGSPHKSPTASYTQPVSTPAYQRTPGAYSLQSNGNSTYYAQTTPRPLVNSPNMNHLSGLSPTKHSPVIPPPSNIPQKSSMSPAPMAANSMRSVSGTPIFPPVENLAPSPKQLSKSPVPTPSKHASATQIGEEELRRVNLEAQAAAVGLQQTRQ